VFCLVRGSGRGKKLARSKKSGIIRGAGDTHTRLKISQLLVGRGFEQRGAFRGGEKSRRDWGAASFSGKNDQKAGKEEDLLFCSTEEAKQADRSGKEFCCCARRSKIQRSRERGREILFTREGTGLKVFGFKLSLTWKV